MTTNQLPPLVLDYDATVFYKGQRHVIRQESEDFTTVVLFEPLSGKLVAANIVDLSPSEPLKATRQKDLNAHDKEALRKRRRSTKP